MSCDHCDAETDLECPCGTPFCSRNCGILANHVVLSKLHRNLVSQEKDYADRKAACQAERSVTEFFVDKVDADGSEVYIVRDDKLCGGTKSRIALQYLQDYPDYEEYVYPTSWYGGAQIALAWAAKKLGKKAVLFTEPLPKTPKMAYVRIGQDLGAAYHFAANYQRAAAEYASRDLNRRILVDNGLGNPRTVKRLTTIGRQLTDAYGRFDELWVAVGSGTLLQSLVRADLADAYFGVCVFHACPFISNTIVARYPAEQFDEPAREPPDFPSASHYDAKVWDMMLDEPRAPGRKVLFWNVM